MYVLKSVSMSKTTSNKNRGSIVYPHCILPSELDYEHVDFTNLCSFCNWFFKIILEFFHDLVAM